MSQAERKTTIERTLTFFFLSVRGVHAMAKFLVEYVELSGHCFLTVPSSMAGLKNFLKLKQLFYYFCVLNSICISIYNQKTFQC